MFKGDQMNKNKETLWIGEHHAVYSLDLSMTDAMIIADFKRWLKERKEEINMKTDSTKAEPQK